MTADRLDLDALAALEAAATEGEWMLDTADVNARFHVATVTAEALRGEDPAAEVAWGDYDGNVRMRPADAALIVALRNAAPALIAEIRRLRNALAYEKRQRDGEKRRTGGNWNAIGEWSERATRAEAERDAAQAALDATVITARNRLDEIHRLRDDLETAQAALARVTDDSMDAAVERIIAQHLSRLSKRNDWAEDDTAVGGQAAHLALQVLAMIRAVTGEGQEAGGK